MATHSSILAWRIPWTEGAWQATVHRVIKSETRLKWLSTRTLKKQDILLEVKFRESNRTMTPFIMNSSLALQISHHLSCYHTGSYHICFWSIRSFQSLESPTPSISSCLPSILYVSGPLIHQVKCYCHPRLLCHLHTPWFNTTSTLSTTAGNPILLLPNSYLIGNCSEYWNLLKWRWGTHATSPSSWLENISSSQLGRK